MTIWRERLEAGALRLSPPERALLIERLVVAYERYDEISALWMAEVERRMIEIREGCMELVDAEVVLAELEEMEASPDGDRDPPIPGTVEEIQDEALHLSNDDFYLLLTNLEVGLPMEIDPAWRADIQRRIAAIPAEVKRRYRYHNGDWRDDGGDKDAPCVAE